MTRDISKDAAVLLEFKDAAGNGEAVERRSSAAVGGRTPNAYPNTAASITFKHASKQ